ncbi:ISP domain-containing protein [Polyplosphaeria fusca]|uniref:ISP domain-containing protein n=1 Tax=Polyplosphaeria fusca TaxID=682080 RepID=A0A9P4R5L2_9PLEO|nr:ISP domain-containing protein [Polyplosphaeria fusca]
MAAFANTPISIMVEKTSIEVAKEPDLLDGWWTSDGIYQLERRAVFSKTWMCITHRNRFNKPGDYISTEIAGFPILVILGKDRIARAFHNVCRHRAYTITQKPSGSSLVLGCRYHGWSYNTQGNLVKAPQFDNVAGFNKAENGLFGIKTCIDRAGFIYVNLNAQQVDEIPNCEGILDFANKHGIKESARWLNGWEMTGAFNWKTVGAGDRTGIGTAAIAMADASILTLMRSVFRRQFINLGDAKMYLSDPSTILVVFPKADIWVLMVSIPLSARRCNIRVDAFSCTNATLTDRDLEELKSYCQEIVHSFELLYMELKDTPPDLPTSLPLLKAHLKLERLVGHDVLPFKRDTGMSQAFCRAEKLCRDLDGLAHARNGKCAPRVASSGNVIEW